MKNEEFIEIVKKFIKWVQNPTETESSEAKTALILLHSLGLGILQVQVNFDIDFDLDGQNISEEKWKEAYSRFGKLPFNYYANVFNPITDLPPKKPELADLADDLADIYNDLSVGMDLLHKGHQDEAIYSWYWSYYNHWGKHCSSAIHSLTVWREREGPL